MKVIEVKGFIGYAVATLAVVLVIGLVVVLPVMLTQWGWNTWIVSTFESPHITWWQAGILALALLMGLVLLVKQFVSFEIELVSVAPEPSNEDENGDSSESSHKDVPDSGTGNDSPDA